MCVLDGHYRLRVDARSAVHRLTTMLTVAALIALPAAGFAQQPTGVPAPAALNRVVTATAGPQPIANAIPHAVAASLAKSPAGADGTAQEPANRSWVARHPALVGLMAGVGAGAVIGYSLGQECSGDETEPCSAKGGAAVVGAAIFGGIGALTGWLISQATK